MKKIIISVFVITLIWISGCKQDGSKYEIVKEATAQTEKGQEIALDTKMALGKHLIGKMTNGGTLEALAHCNVKAIPVTDSMSTVLKAEVKRVSNKPRNVNNRANNEETEAINKFQTALDNSAMPPPIVMENQYQYRGYYPIITNQMCLNCHGKYGETLSEEVATKINDLYPYDQATGYDLNQVRGIFVVEWNKQQ